MSAINPDAMAETAMEEPGNAQSALIRRQRPSLLKKVVRLLNSSIVSVIVILIAVIWSIPTVGLLITSFRPASLSNVSGWWTAFKLPWSFTIENYLQVIQAQGLGQAFLNSLIIAIPGTIFPVLLAAFAAYAFAWMKFPGRDLIFVAIVALLVIPIQITLIPILNIFTTVGLTGNYAAIWLAHTAYGLPFAVYLLRNFFAALPSDLFESAYIDGASHLTIFFKILLPLSVPSLASLIIFQFMWVWNDLLVALVFLGGSPDKAPLTVNIANMINAYGTNEQLLTSAAFISMALPLVLFFSMQRYFVRGLLAGSVKG